MRGSQWQGGAAAIPSRAVTVARLGVLSGSAQGAQAEGQSGVQGQRWPKAHKTRGGQPKVWAVSVGAAGVEPHRLGSATFGSH